MASDAITRAAIRELGLTSEWGGGGGGSSSSMPTGGTCTSDKSIRSVHAHPRSKPGADSSKKSPLIIHSKTIHTKQPHALVLI